MSYESNATTQQTLATAHIAHTITTSVAWNHRLFTLPAVNNGPRRRNTRAKISKRRLANDCMDVVFACACIYDP